MDLGWSMTSIDSMTVYLMLIGFAGAAVVVAVADAAVDGGYGAAAA